VWDALPLPKDDDWQGSKTAPATVQGTDLVLRGEYVRTRATYDAPVTVEFDILFENAVSDGCLYVMFVPENSPKDEHPATVTEFVMGYGKPGQLLVARHVDSVRDYTKLWEQSVELVPNHQYHVLLNVRPGALGGQVDGKAFDLSNVSLPYKRFYIQLRGWHPPTQWRVRNFVVR